MVRVCGRIAPTGFGAKSAAIVDLSTWRYHITGSSQSEDPSEILKIFLFIAASLLVAFGPTSAPTEPADGSAQFDDVRLAYFRVDEQGSDLVIAWEAELEENVKAYEVQRRSSFSNGKFVVAKEYEPLGINLQYLYTDDQVFKSASDAQDMIDYQLVVVYQSGARQIVASKSINYTSTALRRTWGSIKAMF